MKLTSLQVSDVKRIKAVSIEFNENGMTIIGGRNRQGKTSILSSIMYAIGGEKYRPSNFKREGSEEEGFIRLTFDDGMIVERKGKNSSLTVIDSTGKKAGQELLNAFVSKFSIDLPKFLNASDKEKADILLKIIGVEDQLKELDDEEKSKYDERHLVGLQADQKDKACKELAFYPDVPEEEVKVIDLTNQLQEIVTRNASLRASVQKIEENKMLLVRKVQNGENLEKQKATLKVKVEAQREAIKKQLEALEESYVQQDANLAKMIDENNAAVDKLTTDIANAESVEIVLEDTSAVEAKIKDCENINAKVRANKDRALKLKEADSLHKEYDHLTEEIEDVRRRRKELLDGADLPYPGLSVQNGVLYLNGKAWDCMSGSEQLIVACAIAQAIKPDCKFMIFDKLEQFDLTELAKFEKWFEERGLQGIATRVSSGDECSIIIEDGMVVGEENVVINKTTPKPKKVAPSDETGVSETIGSTSADNTPAIDISIPDTQSDAMVKAMELLSRKRSAIAAESSAD